MQPQARLGHHKGPKIVCEAKEVLHTHTHTRHTLVESAAIGVQHGLGPWPVHDGGEGVGLVTVYSVIVVATNGCQLVYKIRFVENALIIGSDAPWA